MKAVHKLLSVGVVCASLSASYMCPAVAQTKLGVINQPGDVWAHDQTTTTVGLGVKLSGGPIAGPNDEFVFGKINEIAVVNKSGELWLHTVTDQSVFPGHHVP